MSAATCSFAISAVANGKAAASSARRSAAAKAPLGGNFGAIRGGVMGLPKRRASPVPRASMGGGNGNSGGNGGNGGNGGWNNWGGEHFDGMGGSGGLAMAAVAYPAYDISAKLDMNKVFIFIADILLPFLGVYLYFKKTNKYVWTSLVLTFLPPLGIIFALLVTFGGFTF